MLIKKKKPLCRNIF